jgi:hypothetical protein
MRAGKVVSVLFIKVFFINQCFDNLAMAGRQAGRQASWLAVGEQANK